MYREWDAHVETWMTACPAYVAARGCVSEKLAGRRSPVERCTSVGIGIGVGSAIAIGIGVGISIPIAIPMPIPVRADASVPQELTFLKQSRCKAEDRNKLAHSPVIG
jgi:hypothetical protein